MTDLLVRLGIVDACAAREMFTALGFLLAGLAGVGVVLWAASAELGRKGRSAVGYARANPAKATAVLVFVLAAVLYGGSKARVPASQQCDFRCSGAETVSDSSVLYLRSPDATNVDVAVCGGACTTGVAFASGQFYYEYDARAWPAGVDASVGANGFWVRDSETNDWTGSASDLVLTGTPAGWVSGWHGAVAHLPGYADPMDFRFWFVGPRGNLPEKVTEVGEGIEVVRQVRDAFHVFVEFSVDEEHYRYTRFVFEMRRVKDGILLDWEEVAETEGRTFNVTGFLVDQYTETRIRGYREERK